MVLQVQQGITNQNSNIMAMVEIFSERGHERGSGLGRAIKDFKESLEDLKEDFYTVMDEFEEFGERSGGSGSNGGNSGGSSRGGNRSGGSMGYRDKEEERYWREMMEDEEYGERRGRRRRRR